MDKALDLLDKETEGHTQRVAGITTQLALSMEIPEKDIISVRREAFCTILEKQVFQTASSINLDHWTSMGGR